MKDFKDFISAKEEKKYDNLNEDVITTAMTILGVTSLGALVALGGAFIIYGYTKLMSTVINKLVFLFRKIKKNIKGVGKNETIKVINGIKNDPRSKIQKKHIDNKATAYEESLEGVIPEIREKNFNNARTAFKELPKTTKDNPDIRKIIISEISQVLKEPPLYVSSPGNETYRMIKKIIDIGTARAAAEATRLSLDKEIEDQGFEEIEAPEKEEEKLAASYIEKGKML